jgi:hypothetical protein
MKIAITDLSGKPLSAKLLRWTVNVSESRSFKVASTEATSGYYKLTKLKAVHNHTRNSFILATTTGLILLPIRHHIKGFARVKEAASWS